MLKLKYSNGKPLKVAFPIKILNEQGNEIYFENSNGYWCKRDYNEQGNINYYEDSNGYWHKREFDEQGNVIYYEDSDDTIEDNRPKVKEYSIEELETLLGHPLKIKAKEG